MCHFKEFGSEYTHKKKMEIVLFLLTIFLIQNITTAEYTVYIDEGDSKVIECSEGMVLNISYASYDGKAVFCSKHEVTSLVQVKCQWRRSCTLQSTDDIYRDTCAGPDESLNVKYNCQDDCYYVINNKIFYNGTTSITKSGKKCQNWESNIPHIPNFRPKGQRNYCRNPDNDTKIWCYTTDPLTRWEYCDIQQCVPVSSSTLWTLDPTTTSAPNHTKWQTEGLTDSATDSSSVSWTDNPELAQPRESMVSHNTTNETITIAVLIAGCIFGLVFAAIITIAVIRRFRNKKARTSDNVQILQVQMNIENPIYHQEPDTGLLTHGQASDDYEYQTLAETSGNICFRPGPTIDQTSPATMVDDTAITRCKAVNEVEYSSTKRESSDSLPPPYDVAKTYLSFDSNSKNMYNHAHYFGDSYDKTDERLAPCNNTDGYSTPGMLHLDSAHCTGCLTKSEHVYENTTQGAELISNKAATSCLKNEHDWSRKSNQYDNIMLTRSTPSGHKNNETVEWNDNRQNQGYMAMNFGEVKDDASSDNVYVPIRSPTALSPSDVFDDTYQA